ncbi:hypothetical protein AB0C28_30210 [Nonomuraea sp. NPDC048892]|uniref:hypothetical protein n=1 Tax=Nonomuraea sp. NPDC048892 TaxID=3154624 RepID=UPI0033CA3042
MTVIVALTRGSPSTLSVVGRGVRVGAAKGGDDDRQSGQGVVERELQDAAAARDSSRGLTDVILQAVSEHLSVAKYALLM